MNPQRSIRRQGLRLLPLIGLLAAPSIAAAQAGVPLDSMIVGLWPEYDRRQVLVIYRANLPAETTLPTQVFLPVPAEAAELTAVAYREASGQLLNASYERVQGDPVDTVVVEVAGLEVQLEYYAPLAIEGDQRSFTFAWPGTLSAASFGFEIQQPFGAEAMEVTPPASTRTTDAQGLVYHNVTIGAVGPQERPQVSFRYTKADDRLSAEIAAPAAALAAPPTSTASPIDLGSVLPYGLLLAGLSLIAVGVVYYLRTRQAERRARPRHRPAGGRAEGDREVDASPVFCHSCGAQAAASDRYCRRCGTALRG
jgi:hypothetical protein